MSGRSTRSFTAVIPTYERNSDGSLRELLVNHPFYALDTRQASGMDVLRATRIDSPYDLGVVTDRFQEGYRTAVVRIGWSDRMWGADREALVFSSNASRGFSTPAGSMLLLAASLAGRVEHAALRNATLSASATYYLVESRHALLYAALQGEAGQHLDLDNQILLGGDSGLRGYPLRYQTGTREALVTLEQRYFTDWYPFRLWRVGAAAFVDAGKTWGQVPLAPPSLGLLEDVGVGLRFGNTRSGLGNVTHAALAMPLDRSGGVKSLQFLIQTEQGF